MYQLGPGIRGFVFERTAWIWGFVFQRTAWIWVFAFLPFKESAKLWFQKHCDGRYDQGHGFENLICPGI
jgi:hypothetical protein